MAGGIYIGDLNRVGFYLEYTNLEGGGLCRPGELSMYWRPYFRRFVPCHVISFYYYQYYQYYQY